MVEGLDWNTSWRNADLKAHWRMGVGIVVRAAVGYAILHAALPHTLWFLKLWCAVATGGWAGEWLGFRWQTRDGARRRRTSAGFHLLFFLGWGALGLVAVGLLIPDMYKHEAERAMLRSLTADDVRELVVKRPHWPSQRIGQRAIIERFVRLCRQAELFYPSHEGLEQEVRLTVVLADGRELDYRAAIPERHRDDLALVFKRYFAHDDILLPRGARWFGHMRRYLLTAPDSPLGTR